MHKKTKPFSSLLSILVFFLFGFILLGDPAQQLFKQLAAEEESISLTTYYPAPYGVYNSMAVNHLGVGDNNGDGNLNQADVPAEDGDVWINGSVGIGTVDPDEELHIKSDQPYYKIEDSDDGEEWTIGHVPNAFVVMNTNHAFTSLTLNDGGNVTIGKYDGSSNVYLPGKVSTGPNPIIDPADQMTIRGTLEVQGKVQEYGNDVVPSGAIFMFRRSSCPPGFIPEPLLNAGRVPLGGTSGSHYSPHTSSDGMTTEDCNPAGVKEGLFGPVSRCRTHSHQVPFVEVIFCVKEW